MKYKRMPWCCMLVIYTKQKHKWNFLQYVLFYRSELICLTRNMCCDAVPTVQVLLDPFKSIKGITPTCVQQNVFVFIDWYLTIQFMPHNHLKERQHFCCAKYFHQQQHRKVVCTKRTCFNLYINWRVSWEVIHYIY